jgi:hypothetical protein
MIALFIYAWTFRHKQYTLHPIFFPLSNPPKTGRKCQSKHPSVKQMSKEVECKGNVIPKPSHFHFLSISLSSRQTPSTGRVRSLGSEHAWGCSLPRERTLMGQDMICFANSRNCLFDEFVLALIRTYSTESTVADSRGAKDYENIIHKVSIRLDKRLIVEERSNVDENPAGEQPNVDVVAAKIVVVCS